MLKQFLIIVSEFSAIINYSVLTGETEKEKKNDDKRVGFFMMGTKRNKIG